MTTTKTNIWLWVTLGLFVVLVLVPGIVAAQAASAAYLGNEAAKALDEARVDSAWGYIGAVLFVVVIACAVGTRSMKLGILGVCIAIGVAFLYNGGTVAKKVIPTTGERIIQ